MSGRTVIKIGGSLIPAHAAALCAALKNPPLGEKLVLVAGGGDIVEVIRGYRQALELSDATTIAMALLAMDQHGLLLAELGGFTVASTFEDVVSVARPVCVLTPAREVQEHALIEEMDVDRLTSDAIAALIAARLGASLVIATDVDGVYDEDPRLVADAALLAEVRACDLKRRTSIDVEAAAAIQRFQLRATVLNGTMPQRLADHLAGLEVRRTTVLA